MATLRTSGPNTAYVALKVFRILFATYTESWYALTCNDEIISKVKKEKAKISL